MPIPSTHPRSPSVRRRAVVALTLAASLVLALAGPAAARRGDGSAGTSGEAGDAIEVPIDPRLGPTVPGIDVSHWQGTINWAKVAGAGKRFVFLKATDGQDYIDPTFATNRAGARENGLMVGAYHFARPDDSAGDAIKEAQFFVEVADPKPGHLLPVLDIETNDGLSHDEMTAWAHRFVMEVRDLTGVMPFVYTSPYGWLDRFGDSRRLARDGAPLWVAHWGVSSPTLPAGDWDGRGWVVWQHSSTGHVAGIAGNVDLDVLAGASLGRIAIRRLTVQVDGGAGGVTTAPVGYGCRTTCERNVDPDTTITLTASPDEGAYFTGWGGDCSGTGPTCTITTNGNRTVTAGFVNDITPPVVALATPSGLSDPAVVSFDEPVRGVNPSNVVLRAPGQQRVDATRVCRNDEGEVRDCDANVTRTVQLIPKAPLVPGRDYIVVVNPDSATTDDQGPGRQRRAHHLTDVRSSADRRTAAGLRGAAPRERMASGRGTRRVGRHLHHLGPGRRSRAAHVRGHRGRLAHRHRPEPRTGPCLRRRCPGAHGRPVRRHPDRGCDGDDRRLRRPHPHHQDRRDRHEASGIIRPLGRGGPVRRPLARGR